MSQPAAPQTAPAPSGAELDILKVLWRQSPLSARQVHDAEGPAHGWSLSTTRTLMERMVDKGLVEKTRQAGGAVYAPALSKAAQFSRLIKDFAGRVLEIEGAVPAALFTGSKVLDDADLAELEALLASPGDNGDDDESESEGGNL